MSVSHIGLHWYALRIVLPDDVVDRATAVLEELGFRASEVIERSDHTELVVYVKARARAEAVRQAKAVGARLSGVLAERIRIDAIDERIWTEDWKRHFQRRVVAGRIEIVAPWQADEPPAEGCCRVVINPGLAFGTGQHETTLACLELLVEHVRPGDHVLDFGCGSGILAIAAARLGAARVDAIDQDPVSVNVARSNVVMNKVGLVVDVAEGDIPPRGRTYNVVVANILSHTLISMSTALTCCVRNQGTLILAGIESCERRLVEDAFGERGLSVCDSRDRDGWASLALVRSRV